MSGVSMKQDVAGVNCVKDANGQVMVENDQVEEVWNSTWRNC